MNNLMISLFEDIHFIHMPFCDIFCHEISNRCTCDPLVYLRSDQPNAKTSLKVLSLYCLLRMRKDLQWKSSITKIIKELSQNYFKQ